VRLAHWIGASAVLTLAVTGFIILMAHPRLYWGDVGNGLTPPLIELPISRNYHHVTFEVTASASPDGGGAVSARTYHIFNQNRWARSLHFLAAWVFLVTGIVYLVVAFTSGHLRRHLVPSVRELTPRLLWQDLLVHLRRPLPRPRGGPPYNLLQRCTYSLVICAALPVMVVTGFGMSPAINATYPFVSDMFGGSQSARTLHFAVFCILVLFVVIHLVMVIRSGFRQQMRAITLGSSR
jgi:thiosulfate reductase cytochrome b subunit